jgi:hypothetical protein
VLTIGSIVLSSIGLVINLLMGAFFISFGWFMVWGTRSLDRVRILSLVFMLGAILIGSIMLVAGAFRVFGEGYAIFG